MTTDPPHHRSTVRRGFAILGHGIRSQPRSFTIATLGAALYAAMTVGSALVLGRVTDRVVLPAFETGAVERGAVAIGAGAIVGVAVLKSVGIVVRRLGATHMQASLQAIHRRQVIERYQSLPMSWHRRYATGELLSRANSDVEATFWPVAPLPLSAGVVVMLLLAATVFLATDLVVAGVAFVLAPAIAVASWRYNRLMAGPSTRAQELRAQVSAVAHESFDAALVVKTLGREEEETRRFRARAEELRDTLVEVGRLRAVFDPFIEALPSVGVLLVLLVGTWRISTADLQAGELVQLAFLFTLLAFPIRAIGYLLSEMPASVVGWSRVQEVLAARDQLPWGDRTTDGDGPADVDLVEVTFGYEDQPVLHDVTVEALRGRTVAIVGPTGAGKSTIASLLVRLADPHAGTVRLDGHDLRSLRDGVLSRDVAVVFQESFLFGDTIRENITLGEPFTDEQVRAAARLAQADGFIRRLSDGYDTVVGERGATLSGGQRQRIALARALVRRPRLLVLDDATSNVDARVEAAILRGLKRAELPSTIVVVAYRRATIALADQIVYVEDGRVRATGTHDELVDQVPGYVRLLQAHDAPRRPGPGGRSVGGS